MFNFEDKATTMSEKTLHRAVCDYIKYQYPGILFNSDMSGAMRLTIGQAVQIKALRSNRGYPDIVIYEPRGIYHGLFIELKKDGEKLYKKNGECATEHILEQAACIARLNAKGYKACFAIGANSAIEIIDQYLTT